MKSYLVAAGDEEYKEALSATELSGIPAEGFRKIQELEIVSKGIASIIKQNNTAIYLLIKALKKLEVLETKVARLEDSLIKTSKENPQFQEALEKLIQEVNRIKITKKEKQHHQQ